MVDGPDGRLGQRIAGVAVELHATGLVEPVRRREVERPRRLLQNGPGVQEIGAREADAAFLPTEDAKRQVAVACDRRKEKRRLEGELPDPERHAASVRGGRLRKGRCRRPLATFDGPVIAEEACEPHGPGALHERVVVEHHEVRKARA
jgi:hypothetical protein